MAINLNEMARTVAIAEGGKREVDIAQIKQIMRLFLIELGKYSEEEILTVINNYR